ncbi:uncharacterized protein JN550_007963 [Neoarthrinium moseri]|uniref:uncharacterized protein n=1 Tax=Neoarthrinium moseri TaxID=1658444 RepID=UPI001FDD959F|nr:uncharacterized protein JN550_007963 [Neoarthrinium moseri]KAI1865985.1 hypothetical protein JN550_007963 [Neoarthrinium moseri]
MAQAEFNFMSPQLSSLRRSPNLPVQDEAGPSIPEPAPREADPELLAKFREAETTTEVDRVIIGIDFGTTYSSVSQTVIRALEDSKLIGRDRIKPIRNFPYDPAVADRSGSERSAAVPSEIIYPHSGATAISPTPLNASTDARNSPISGGLPTSRTRQRVLAVDRSLSAEDCFRQDEEATSESSEDDEQSIETHDAEEFHRYHNFNLLRCGFEAQSWPLGTDIKLSRVKLMLQNDPRTAEVREYLSPLIQRLIDDELIRDHKDHVDVIADYLTFLLRHVKSELIDLGLYQGYKYEVVLCVPAIWDQKACRDMQIALAKAFKQSNFDQVEIIQNSVKDLFMVSEPEAAAAWVLHSNYDIVPEDRFILLDAGGGTVDTNTYRVSQKTPLRLEAETALPAGRLCGSSYLNEKFFTYIRRVLAGETYLERDGVTLDGIANTITINEFEQYQKRTFTYYEHQKISFYCPGLRENRAMGFWHSRIWVPAKDMKAVFKPVLKEVFSLVQDQIKQSELQGQIPNKIVLVGGFSRSVALRKYLTKNLDASYKNQIRLIIPPEYDASAVASGGILRALNKEGGPGRFARSSYGILRDEPYRLHEEHLIAGVVRPGRDSLDGALWVRDTIFWALKLGNEEPLGPVWTSEPLPCTQSFDSRKTKRRRLIAIDRLYVSDTATESHYQRNHQKNEGAKPVGEIVTDFTFLRDNGLIQPVKGIMTDEGQRWGRKHYDVDYHLYLRLVGRDLKCYAVYNNSIVQQSVINISSAFAAGVK